MRGCDSRVFDLEAIKNKPFIFGREYSYEEIWENYCYFLDKVIPVAEKANIVLAQHPNDPPLPVQLGVASLIHNVDCYRRILTHFPNKTLGVLLCIGCWLEGGKNFGDPVQNTLELVKTGRVYDCHFRNIIGSIPHFTEAFLDNGSTDMFYIMNALCEGGYRGTIELDHSPVFSDDPSARTANGYAIGYMRALAQRAIAQAKT